MPEFIPSAHLLLMPLLLWNCNIARAHLQLAIGDEIILEFQPDEYKTYKHTATNNATSLIVMACTAPLEWNVFQSAVGGAASSILLHSSVTNERGTYDFPRSPSSEYTIKLKMNHVGYGVIVLTNTPGRPSKKSSHQKLLQMKWRSEHDLVLRWHKHTKRDSAHTDPNYCVLISTSSGRLNSNLCASLLLDEYKHLRATTVKQFAASFCENFKSTPEQSVYCTNTNLLKLNVDQLIHPARNESKHVKLTADLFVFDEEYNIPRVIASNETFPVTPTAVLKENRIAYIQVDDEPVTLSLKLSQGSFVNNMLDVYVVPCDVRTRLNIDVAFNGNHLAALQDIVGFGKVSVPNVQLRKSYTITVSPRREYNGTKPVFKGVQVFASTLASAFNPFPEMPRRPAVKEYRTLRTCRAVTLGWIPPSGLRGATYCLVVKMGRVSTQGNQCNMNGQLRRGHVTRQDVAKMCKQMKHTARISVLTQRIDKLKAGKLYTVQILVRKPRGRMLSYGTLQVRTKATC